MTLLRRKCGVEYTKYKRPQKASAPYFPEIKISLLKSAVEEQDLDAYNALLYGNLECKEQYLVPIAWHVIYNSQGRGNVSDSLLEDQIHVLNGKN